LTRISKRYFDKKLRVGKLDSALLFLSSTVGLIFAVIRAAINPSASIVTAIPLIVLGIVLPFYYGYVRGALVRSSTVDRIRGWVFFLVGLGAYGYSITIEWMNEVLPAYVGRGAYLVDVPVAVVAVLAAFLIGRRFHGFMFKVLSESPSKIIGRAALLAAMSAILFAFVGSEIATSQTFNPWLGLGLFMLLASGLFYLNRSGRYAGYANSDVQYSVEVIRGRWHDKKLISWFVTGLHYGGVLLFAGATLYFLTAASTATDVFNYLVELIVALSLIVANILLSPRVGEREVYRDREQTSAGNSNAQMDSARRVDSQVRPTSESKDNEKMEIETPASDVEAAHGKSVVKVAGEIGLLMASLASALAIDIYVSLWLVDRDYPFIGVIVFVVWFSALVAVGYVKFLAMFPKNKDLTAGKLDEWVLVVAVLGAVFATGSAFQSVSSIGSGTLSDSNCSSPAGVNVTSINCQTVHTVTRVAPGPFWYFSHLGIWTVVIASIGLLTFGMVYVLIRQYQSMR